MSSKLSIFENLPVLGAKRLEMILFYATTPAVLALKAPNLEESCELLGKFLPEATVQKA